MKNELAETLLAKLMGWSDAQKAAERARLQAFAAYKYDEYQQFAPGRRFLESLALWLRQFKAGEERQAAYEFVRERLVFISNAEMNHLVELAFPTVIRPRLIEDSAREVDGLDEHRPKAVMATEQYRARLRRALVLGLSDGARTDQFRRSNPQAISNEQVFHAYDVSPAKAKNMASKLQKDLAQIFRREPSEEETCFQYVVLLDDFTASGTSYIREDDELVWDGKIPRIVRQLEADDDLGGVIAKNGVRVTVVIYVAAPQAIEHIAARLHQLTFSKGSVEFCVIHELSPQTRLSKTADGGILKLAKKDAYFDVTADDEHGALGGTSKRLGYADGRLPLVLSHNTPNNSIFLLWAEEVHNVLGLFPRVSRHRKFE